MNKPLKGVVMHVGSEAFAYRIFFPKSKRGREKKIREKCSGMESWNFFPEKLSD